MGNSKANQHERAAHLRWIPITDMVINPKAQRELNESRVNKIVANLDIEQIGTITLSERNMKHYILDGQHRVEALKRFGFNSPEDKFQCWVYYGLTEDQEADTFLKLNDVLVVDAMSKFKVGVEAGRPIESDINRIVMSNGLRVSRENGDGAIRAVGTLTRVYQRNGVKGLSRSLQIIRDGFGDAGFEAAVIDGMGMVAGNYNGALKDDELVKRLQKMSGGVAGLLNRAEQTRRATGNPKGQCVAATIVEVYNQGKRGGNRLPDWWASA